MLKDIIDKLSNTSQKTVGWAEKNAGKGASAIWNFITWLIKGLKNLMW